MARNRQNLNIIYISDRMRETLRPIASCALTAVVAPMGYGKTTAVRWFLAEQAKAGAVVLQASIYSDNRSIFWKSVQKAFAAAGLTVLEGYDCPADASGAALLLEDLCAALGGKTPYYLFLDDFHLLGDERVAQFLCRLAYRLPENVHLIVASRNRFLPGEQVVRLGRRLHRIEADGLRLNREELLAYTHRCGVEITAAQAESLLRSCEGWFSAVYLNLHALAERGSLLQPGSDIYAMFTAAMLESLPEKTRGFLAVMGLADEFTVEMARAVTALPDAEEVLRALTQQNAFVTRLPDGVSFRFHHMMKECAERLFAQLPAARQTEVWQRYGRWYAQKAQYLHALQALEQINELLESYCEKHPEHAQESKSFVEYIKEHSGMNVNDPVYQVSDHALFQLNTLLEKLLEDSKKAANEVLLKKRELRKQLNNVESYLSLDIDESTLEKIRNQMKEIEAEVVRIEVHIKDVQQKSSEINGKLTEKNAELRDAVDIYLKNAEFLDDSERMMKYSNLALRILNEYSVALQSRKARALSETITACYKKLASKKNLIERIEMDPETLDVHYFGEDGMIVDQGSLSAGEKQLMVISILWALAICSKKKLPVIIDTPLSRLDSTHRAALVTTYFPQASEQTIILSTDSEIDRHYYDMMQEYIGDEFTLNYSEETKSTTISRGYFQER